MSTADQNETVLAAEAPDEVTAAIWIAELQANGIEARMAGALSSGFRAEAPGVVNILVHKGDVEKARELIAHQQSSPPSE